MKPTGEVTSFNPYSMGDKQRSIRKEPVTEGKKIEIENKLLDRELEKELKELEL